MVESSGLKWSKFKLVSYGDGKVVADADGGKCIDDIKALAAEKGAKVISLLPDKKGKLTYRVIKADLNTKYLNYHPG